MDIHSDRANDAASMKYEIDRFLLSDEFELLEDGSSIGTIDRTSAGTELSYGKVIFSCWGDGWSRSWRVLRIKSNTNGVELECSKQLGLKTSVLELRRGPAEIEIGETRREFADWVTRLVGHRLAGFSVDRTTVARVDRRHLSGNYVRMLLRQTAAPERPVCAIAASPAETQPIVDGMLGAGIVWLDEMRRRSPKTGRLILIVPKDRAGTIATRLTAVNQAAAPISLYEFDRREETVEPIAAFDQGDLSDSFKRAAKSAVWPDHASLDWETQGLVDSMTKVAPEFIESRRLGNSVIFSIRGLDFAAVRIRQHAAYFGLNMRQRRLNATTWPEMENLVARIIEQRSPSSVDRGSEFYRAYSERWLESILRREAGVIDPDIDQRYVYSQVPTYRGEQRTFMDLLTVTRGGRLVIMELKVSEDPDFPLQALDYWLRVEWHRSRGDFHRRGYFRGIDIQPLPPLLFLVAPLFSFHATTALISGCISDTVPLFRIGINNGWRSGVRVLLREKLN